MISWIATPYGLAMTVSGKAKMVVEETEISGPETETDETTSNIELSDESTSIDEVNNGVNSAETETGLNGNDVVQNDGQELLAGKYKTVDELVKGYQELNKDYTQYQQIQSKYNELLKQQKAFEDQKLAYAKNLGFNTVQDKEIADKLSNYEYQKYFNALNYLPEDSQKDVFNYLNSYTQTGDKRYLNAAKAYYSSEFVEQVARDTFGVESQLKQQYELRTQKEKQEQEAELVERLKADYGEWAQSIKDCKPINQALDLFYNAGFIKSSDDMKVFTEICDGIMKFASDKAVKEYEANKAIEATKEKAVIDGNSSNKDVINSKPKPEDISKMSQKQFDAVCEKYGTDWIYG